ncbi:HEAT repeat domain-containing protein [Thermomonospora umbrina]|uniref:HEAT repeat protein n=1 Tax=Thermomonospora umbrina TaxID=111806 RepID=A0A3D9SVT9_9ACTN|nr:HEAT repeat domain-containing protein [Thermomonospora umbrina]REE97105.1 HEAT repeat protein [Thermomonospora umbrina]
MIGVGTTSGRPDVARPALTSLATAGASAVHPALRHGHPAIRVAAAGALATVGEHGDLPRLSALLADDDPWVRAAAARALGVLGDRRAIDHLHRARHDERVDGHTTRDARRMLGT